MLNNMPPSILALVLFSILSVVGCFGAVGFYKRQPAAIRKRWFIVACLTLTIMTVISILGSGIIALSLCLAVCIYD